MTLQTPSPSSWPVRSLRVRYLMLLDLLLICLAVVGAVFLRFDRFEAAWLYLQNSWTLLLVAPAVRLPIYFRLNLYNRLWRYASLDEFRSVITAAAIAPLLIAVVNFGLLPWLDLPYSASRSIWLLEAICSGGVLAGSRLLLRVLGQRDAPQTQVGAQDILGIPTLIVGAGDAGAMILREIQLNRASHLNVMAFIDDDPAKHWQQLQGVTVMGDRTQIPALVRQFQVQEIIIAMPTAPGEAIRGIVQICKQVEIQPKILPMLYDLMNGRVQLQALREVQIEDLLRRAPIQTDIEGVRQLLRGKRILVTGGGGSIGGELCRQILRCNPSMLLVLGHGENSVFEMEHELLRLKQQLGVTSTIECCIADIRMPLRVNAIFEQARPQIVFHAAAHKHVPLMESNPSEAVTNNVLGTPPSCAGGRDVWGRTVCDGLVRQGGQPHECDGGNQTRRGAAGLGECAAHGQTLGRGTFWQCARQPGECGVDVQTPDCRGWSGDAHAPGDHALFHDHPRSGAIGAAGGGDGPRRRSLYV